VPKSATTNSTRHQIERALILATPRGKIQFADQNARRWIKQLLGPRDRKSHLPPQLSNWLLAAGSKPIALRIGGKLQHVRLYLRKKALTKHSIVLALDLVSGKTEREMRRRHRGLTAREQEVLFWLAHGKTNADIAAILGVAPATVGKHLERIYPKLGVENRTAASTFVERDLTRMGGM
jgi:DNA-binding CsgD family transcriptional regulator